MPRSTIANRVSKSFDKLTEFYAAETAAISATTNSTPIAFPATRFLDFNLFINPAVYTGYVAGTTAWTIQVSACATVGGTYVPVGQSIELNGTAAQRNIALAGVAINQIVPGAEFLRVTATKVGTPGNLQFGAFLSDVG